MKTTSRPKALQPAIKWTGSKRSVAPTLAALWPTPVHHQDRVSRQEDCTYYEPFVGGGAMLPLRPCQRAIAGDVIPELIALWRIIRDNPDLAALEYACRWEQLQQHGQRVYYDIRTHFNQTRNPYDFLFLVRTCTNGLVRYNARGDFNNSFHVTRPGIHPDRLQTILRRWSDALQGVTFLLNDYRTTIERATTGDCIFFDPPYANTKGQYLPRPFDYHAFWRVLDGLSAKGVLWILTFDGNTAEHQYTQTAPSIPRYLYKFKALLPTGNSPFRKTQTRRVHMVWETVYLNFTPPAETVAALIQSGALALPTP